MKNTLAENLLRFGVKNLSESEKKKLHEQLATGTKTNPKKLPGVKVTAKKPKSKPIPYMVSFNTVDSQNKPVVGTAEGFAVKQPDGKLAPSDKISLKMPSNKGIQRIDFVRQGNVYTYSPYSLYKNRKELAAFFHNYANRIAKPLKPQTALTQLIAQINKGTGANLTLNPQVVAGIMDGWDYQSSGVTKRALVPKLSGLLTPMKSASLYVTYDPETGQEIHREMWLGNSNVYTYQKYSDGKIKKTGGSNVLNDRPDMAPARENRKQFDAEITALYNQLESMPLR